MPDISGPFLGALIIYCLFILAFLHILKAGLFGVYVLWAKKTPEEIREFAKGLKISIQPMSGLGWMWTYDNAPDDAIEKALGELTYGRSLFWIGFGGSFPIFASWGLFTGAWESIHSNDLIGAIIFSAWLALALWRFVKTLLVFRLLRAKDYQLQVASID